MINKKSISEQVHYLRSLAADQTPEVLYEVFDALNEAADTIEFVSVKLADMERSEKEIGGWIMCKNDNLPEHEVLCCDNCGEMIFGYVCDDEESITGFCAENDSAYMCNCVKWMEKPKP